MQRAAGKLPSEPPAVEASRRFHPISCASLRAVENQAAISGLRSIGGRLIPPLTCSFERRLRGFKLRNFFSINLTSAGFWMRPSPPPPPSPAPPFLPLPPPTTP